MELGRKTEPRITRTGLRLWSAGLIAVFLVLVSCRGDQSLPAIGYVSLLDEIPDETPAGKWSLLVFSGLPQSPSKRAREDTPPARSTAHPLICEARFDAGSTIILRLAYARSWGSGGTVEARIVVDGRVVATAVRGLGKSRAELRLSAPESGKGHVEIVHHLIRDEGIPLQSIQGLQVQRSAGPETLTRAGTLLAWAVRAESTEVRPVLHLRKFGLTREGSRRDAVALVGRDTLELNLPPLASRTKLRFWVADLRLPPEGRSRLTVEGHDGEVWRKLATLSLDGLAAEKWERMDVSQGVMPGIMRLRFVLDGRDEVVALGSPILIAEAAKAPRKKNVILIDLDTMRADRLGCYGYRERPTSVHLDSILAARGFFVFKRAYAAGPWTVPATAKFMTSRYRNIDVGNALPRECTTLAELLRWNGYYCAAFTGG
ncbi:MAG: sulfatase-like hydrolase/transferase, partial [Candidatus Eisenbacteria bacterium]|nr:sulfatase-like hydrolase/transferase [Candidatus Eisenbacteria bacterium]